MPRPSADATTIAHYAPRLLRWFDRHGRHDLPWQHPRTPYRVWLSEIMLQQTQVVVVVPYFQRFVAALPDLAALAAASQDDVLALWSGLGYYSRARNLHAAARMCMQRHDGELPRSMDDLMALPGIGRSTAGAILAQAWGDPAPILDGNVRRVLARVHGIHGWPGAPAVEKRLWAIAEAALPATRMADYTQAQMDFGATLCTRHDPSCVTCPLQDICLAFARGQVDRLPSPKPSKALPQRDAIVLLLRDGDGCVLLQRRPPAGVWASLWSLPQFDDEAAADAWLQRHFRKPRRNRIPMAPIVHGFSHYRLTLHPQRIDAVVPATHVGDNEELRWVARSELAALGIPAPIRKLLESTT